MSTAIEILIEWALALVGIPTSPPPTETATADPSPDIGGDMDPSG